MLLTVYDTEWPILCWCAVKKLLTHSLTPRERGDLGSRTPNKNTQLQITADPGE